MRITSLHVDGFGSLQGKQLDTDSPVALFYGANEAGKSTLMGFVRAVLFGFPPRSNRAERYEPLGGGTHGGALTLLDAQGQIIRVERYDAPAAGGRRASAGLVKVTLGDGTTGGEELLNTLLGGLSADLFRSLFAFGLTELQELRTLQTDELSGYLYSAGLGVSGSAIMEAERKLTAQADGLYKPRGRNQEINRLLRELEGLEHTLRRSKDHAAEYDRLREERRSAEGRIAALERQQEALQAELHKLSLAGKARSGWLRLRHIGQELAALPALASFPEHASTRLEALEAELERAEAERTRLTVKQLGLQSQLLAMELVPDLLLHQVELNHLLEGASSYEENKRSVIELRVEQEHLRLQVNRLLGQIDERWVEQTLVAFPVSISLREQVRSFRDAFQSRRAAELRIRTEIGSLRAQRSREQEHIQSIEMDLHRKGIHLDRLDAMRDRSLEGSAALQRLSRDYAQWQLLLRDVQHHRERQEEKRQYQLHLEEAAAQSHSSSRRNQQRLFLLMSVLTILVPGWLLVKQDRGTALLVFVLFAVISLYILLAGRGTKPKRSSRVWPSTLIADGRGEGSLHAEEGQRVIEELHRLERSLQDQVQRQMQLHGQAYAEASASIADDWQERDRQFPLQELQPQLDAWLREAETRELQRGEQDRKLEKLRDAKDSLQQLQQQEDTQNDDLSALMEELEQLQTEWGSWLASLQLSIHLSPDAALETIQAIEQGHELLRQLGKLAAKQESLQEVVDRFETMAAAHLKLPPNMHNEPIVALKRWKEQEQHQLHLLAEQQRLNQLYAEGEQDLLVLKETLQRTQERLDQLLTEGSAADGEALRLNERQQEARMKRIDEQYLLETSLESLVGREQLPSFIELLALHGEDELASRLELLESERQKAAEEANERREAVGKLTGEISKLEQGSEHADQLLQAESYRASIRQHVDQYAIVSLSSLLMKKARDVYERDRQPGVLLRASAYFERMTNGQFTAIKSPFGEQRLIAVRANGQLLETSQLSRGTAEQLYLSMRFALVEEYAGKAVLPLVMDDILVNFDEVRMESCLRVIADISSRHQVFLFTCHSHVREAAVRILASHRLIHL
ncbi:AAA family ATPase [Paenibacillus sp. SI8]|uniref:AAA family ATPase n=1 Tax=unclassified Paenibacillus TaxID=185978 RepID=UPI003467A796